MRVGQARGQVKQGQSSRSVAHERVSNEGGSSEKAVE